MANLDVSDLLILKEIYKTRGISSSVEQIGLSQPAISVRLGHLRRHFGDALFVRTSAGMMPTPYLESLLPGIDEALTLLVRNKARHEDFDAATSTRTFRLGLTNVAQMALLPQLLALFEEKAPQLNVESVDLDQEVGHMLEAGELDVAVGFAADLHTGIYQQRLFTEHYACVARIDHPRVQGQLTKAQLMSEEYVALEAPATGYSLLDKELEKQGVRRRIKVKVSSFLGIGQSVSMTNLLAIVPARLAQALAFGGRVQVLKIPVASPSYEVRQYWHERFHREPGNCWLRQIMFNTFLDMPDSPDSLIDSNPL
ncbi:LysR family transcriptional regulator [Pusillimonas noertemannii]|uniref:LysR family transcriptional regulator n=1 Tax=Pusillimonas noertemannii TaxID=305977 RepID=UPI000318A5E7|nr:LysR family transcriptional regulator [Pusillimonas noertemannii]